MKRQIRIGVFETNSSSMHSLVVTKQNDKYTPDEILEGVYLGKDVETGEEQCVWRIWDSDLEFGRSPFRALGTFVDKWTYACASLVHNYNDKVYKELVSLAYKYIPGLKRIELPMTTDSCADKDDDQHGDSTYAQKYGKTEAELVKYLTEKEKDWEIEIEYWKSSNGYWHYKKPFTGYVDENILSGFLKDENISLEEFLTSKKYVVIQDGDEYCYWSDMKKTGLINMKAIEHEYPRRIKYETTD